MEIPMLHYIKLLIVILLTLVVGFYSSLKIYDYLNSEIVVGYFIDDSFVYEPSGERLSANNFEKSIYQDGDDVKMLYNEGSENLVFYGNFYNYFKSFLIAFTILFIGWGMIWNERKFYKGFEDSS